MTLLKQPVQLSTTLLLEVPGGVLAGFPSSGVYRGVRKGGGLVVSFFECIVFLSFLSYRTLYTRVANSIYIVPIQSINVTHFVVDYFVVD